MQAKGRMQINIQMTRIEEIPQTANLKDMLIPVVWFEDVSFQFTLHPHEVKYGFVVKACNKFSTFLFTGNRLTPTNCPGSH
jgi:hypothetical protein